MFGMPVEWIQNPIRLAAAKWSMLPNATEAEQLLTDQRFANEMLGNIHWLMNSLLACVYRLDVSLLHLPAVSDARSVTHGVRTLHGLLSSKPGGASALSVCPRAKPVNLRSRSSTAPV